MYKWYFKVNAYLSWHFTIINLLFSPFNKYLLHSYYVFALGHDASGVNTKKEWCQGYYLVGEVIRYILIRITLYKLYLVVCIFSQLIHTSHISAISLTEWHLLNLKPV